MVSPGSRKEGLVVGAVMAAILIPSRYIVAITINDTWLGTLGVVGTVTMAVLLLSIRGRLGWYGRMVINQTVKFHSGRKKILMAASLVIAMIYGTTLLVLLDAGSQPELEGLKIVVQGLVADDLGLSHVDKADTAMVLEAAGGITVEEYVTAALDLPGFFVNEFNLLAVTMAVADEIMDGWGGFVAAIVAVESAEGIALMFISKRLVRKYAREAT